MATQKQIQANKKNGKLGGVKTEQGKTVSKFNALKHGLFSSQVLLMGENKKILSEMSGHLKVELKPVGFLENILIDRIVASFWRLRRILKIEKDVIEHQSGLEKRNEFDFSCSLEKEKISWEDINFGLPFVIDCDRTDTYSKITRYETAIMNGAYKALHELQKLQATKNGDKNTPLLDDVLQDD